MLINTVYVNGGNSVISIVTGLHNCDGKICVPYIQSMDMEVILKIDEDGGTE